MSVYLTVGRFLVVSGHCVRCLQMLLFSLAIAAARMESASAEILYLASDVYSPGDDSTGDDSLSGDSLNRALPTAHVLIEATEKNSHGLRHARQACEQGDVGAALRAATEIVAAAPDNVDARRVLGYRRSGDCWAGSYAVRRLERGEIWKSQFGWIQAEDLPRFEVGERPLGKRWISAAEDARRHATIDDGWRIRTDHFRVTTNHSREAAARLATQLESLYQIWQQLFGGFYLKPIELLKRFDGKTISGYRSKPFQVNYYRTRDQYIAALRRQQPRIEMTLGIYFDTTRKSHFFAASEQEPASQDDGTIYHEAVHQLFHESSRSARSVGALSNAWLIEGVACYFESLVPHRDPQGRHCFTIGTPTAGRLPAARHRRLVDDFYVPLAELSALGIADFQRRADLPRLYSQSAGLVTFLMHYQGGRYRPMLVKLLQLLYAGRDQPGTLEELSGRSFAELDREYRQYLEALPAAAVTGTP